MDRKRFTGGENSFSAIFNSVRPLDILHDKSSPFAYNESGDLTRSDGRTEEQARSICK